MNREFLLNASLLVAANLLIKPFYVFGIERVIQDRAGAEVYGLYATLFSFSFLFLMVNDLGINHYNNRTIAQKPHLARDYMPHLLLLKALLSLVFLLVVFVAAVARGFGPEVYYLLFFVAVNHILIYGVSYLRSNISGLGMYRADSLISTLDKVFLIGICACLLWANPLSENGNFDIRWFVHAQNIAWMLTALIALAVIYRRVKFRPVMRPNWLFLRAILKKSFPYALAGFLMTVYIRCDIVILEWLHPDGRHQAGVYAASYRLLDAFNMVGFLFAGLLLPMFAKLLAGGAHSQIASLLQFSFRLIWAGTVTFAVTSFFFREEIMALMYPLSVNASNVGYYGLTMGFLILTLVPFSGGYIYGSLLTANNNLRKMNQWYFSAIVINVCLNLLLIPSHGAVGAAIAAFVTQSYVMVGMVWLSKKEMAVAHRWQESTTLAGFVVGTVLANWLVFHFIPMPWMQRFGLGLAAGGAIAYLFGLVRWSYMAEMLKKQESGQ